MSRDSDTAASTSTAGTADIRLTSPDASAPGSSPKFILSAADMGEGLIQALQKIITLDDFDNEILVPLPPIDLDLFKAKFNAKDYDCQYTANIFKPGPKGKGYTHVYISECKSDFEWPDFPKEVKIPTHEEARTWLDTFFSDLPEDPVPYFSGHLDVPYEDLLNPGPEILEELDLADLHRPYWHIGGDKSANRHHTEDLDCLEGTIAYGLRSANLVLAGVKLWILIAMRHTKKFEDFITEMWECNKCSQRVGHQSLLISPSRLEKEEIDFYIKIAGPGKLILPHLCQYHGIVNMGPGIALSVNFKLPGDRLISKGLRRCNRCGVSTFTGRHRVPSVDPPAELEDSQSGDLERAALPSEVPGRKRKACEEFPRKPKTTRAIERRLGDLEKKVKASDPSCRIPQIDPSKLSERQLDVFERVVAIRSKLAMNQLVTLTRELQRQQPVMAQDLDVPQPEDLIDKRILHLKRAVEESALSKFRVRYAQVCLARAVDEDKKDKGLARAGHNDIQARAERLEMSKADINYHLQEGRKWATICGPHEGLLPLILLDSNNKFKIPKKGWHELRGQYLEDFHGLLDDPFTQDLDAAGKVFLDILDGLEKVVKWEPALTDAARDEDLASALKSYMLLTKQSSRLGYVVSNTMGEWPTLDGSWHSR
ncbi:hypothetical protein B0J13DRAFT_514824 [Dactylonectria estremocensis]|uniref:JmjC domain-containing protein n=1 Tax=Dactylonectria estremocensis TaxID=1079267 RepID=A0A9P9D9A1_9HYPO|nr:hypothetical protein B0J13DRAFT_514824 [Dactylonectria estremocensis]